MTLPPEAWLLGVWAALTKAKRAPTKAAQAARAAHAAQMATHSTSGETDTHGKHLPNRDKIGEFTSGAGGGGGGGTDDHAGHDHEHDDHDHAEHEHAPVAGKKKPKRGDEGFVDHDGAFVKNKRGQISYEMHPDAKYNPLIIERHEKDHGMNWISKYWRLAIYHRDGFACVWCGNKAEHGHKLTLDHLTPENLGGTDEPKNLVTTCLSCNSKRKNQTVNDFAKKVAVWTDTPVGKIMGYLKKCIDTQLGREEHTAATKFLNDHKAQGRTFKDAYPHVPAAAKKNRAAHHKDVVPPEKW